MKERANKGSNAETPGLAPGVSFIHMDLSCSLSFIKCRLPNSVEEFLNKRARDCWRTTYNMLLSRYYVVTAILPTVDRSDFAGSTDNRYLNPNARKFVSIQMY